MNKERRQAHAKAWGHKIRELRKKRKFTIAEAARLCGMDQTNYSKIECGGVAFRVDTLTQILDSLGYKMEFVQQKLPRKMRRGRTGT